MSSVNSSLPANAPDDSDVEASTPSAMSVEAALVVLAEERAAPSERMAALKALNAAKFLPKQFDHPAIAAARRAALSDSISPASPEAQLLGIAQVMWLSQVIKKWSDELLDELKPVLQVPLPPLALLSDANDRLNVARACHRLPAPWIATYAAHSIANEETGEKPRQQLMDTLLAQSRTVADAIRALASAFTSLRPETDSPGDTVSRRLARTIIALRAAVLADETPAGDELGAALAELVSAPLIEVGRPQEVKVQVALSQEALFAVHDLLRTRLSVVADPSMFGVVAYCRKMCGGATWPRELDRALAVLTKDLLEAILLLGRQGICDVGLLRQLEVVCNHPERARVLTQELVKQHPSLSESVKHMLLHWRPLLQREVSASAMEAATATADSSIGVALLTSRRLRSLRDALADRIANALELNEPMLAAPTEDLLRVMQTLAIQVDEVASRRKLAVHGDVGAELEFSPKYFVAVGEPRQRMRVRQPAVVKLRDDGSPGDVVTQGLME